jgi:phage tail-like protein
MRTGVCDLPTAHPMGLSLPAVYVDDDFTQRLTQALDEVLAPVLLTLDCLAYYLDPQTAPPDVLEWLAGWVALALDDAWTLERRRKLVANAVDLHRWRGTKRGLAAHVRLLTGGEVDVVDSGGCTWSAQAQGSLPGSTRPSVEVQITGGRLAGVDDRWLRAVVAEALPAHVPVRIRAVAAGQAAVDDGR